MQQTLKAAAWSDHRVVCPPRPARTKLPSKILENRLLAPKPRRINQIPPHLRDYSSYVVVFCVSWKKNRVLVEDSHALHLITKIPLRQVLQVTYVCLYNNRVLSSSRMARIGTSGYYQVASPCIHVLHTGLDL